MAITLMYKSVACGLQVGSRRRFTRSLVAAATVGRDMNLVHHRRAQAALA